MNKTWAIVLLLLGETCSVYAEMLAARAHATGAQPFWPIFWKAFLLITLAGALLIAGYMHGYRSFRNIWIVSALSITSILIMEPLVGYLIFQQLPSRGALFGLIFGALGFVATFVF